MDTKKLSLALQRGVTRSGAPGAAAFAGTLEDDLYLDAYGLRQRVPSEKTAKTDTLYDLASLTKVMATTSAVMLLREDGRLDINAPLTEWLPARGFEGIRISHLLTHSSGLLPLIAFQTNPDIKTLDDAVALIADSRRTGAPGELRVYSDLGFILLGKVIALAAKKDLAEFCEERIFNPLDMRHTTFNPPPRLARDCAATEDDPTRGGVIVGKVHDERAFHLDGVAGHAGLFSNAEDIAKFCRAWLSGKLLPKRVLDEMTHFGRIPSYPWQGLGWKMDPWMSSAEGFLNARNAVGHTGWTGTSLWMDRDTGYFAIHLGNTCHPSRARRNNRVFRRNFYIEASGAYYTKTTNAHSGLDRVLWDAFVPFAGKRAALLTHAPATDQFGRPIAEVMALPPKVALRRIYSPEHGYGGQAEAGEKVSAQGKQDTVPVVSLYGDRKIPTPEELAEVDLFIVDLCDIGSRYYTYVATMKDCMAACAKAGVPVHVLDRPNPIGGTVLEGPIARTHGSPICWAAVPNRHGMTLGECALYFEREHFKNSKLQLTVHRADNWPREFHFGQCALPWRAPSPNIPAAETALLYAGTCLFEGINVNEGRGTSTPFHLVGAPWMNGPAVAAKLSPHALPGCTVTPVSYRPQSIPGKAANPRHLGRDCGGLFIGVTNPKALRPFTTTVAILEALLKVHPNDIEWLPNFDVLAGGIWLRDRLINGEEAVVLANALKPELDAFDAIRPKLYLTWDEMRARGEVIP